jgi:predicted ester cyclase
MVLRSASGQSGERGAGSRGRDQHDRWRPEPRYQRRCLPDLRVELAQVIADGDVALAHGTVRGTATGRLYGAPATRRSFEASFFDYVQVDDGQIIKRVQQADVLSQMRQLYGKALGLVGLDAMFLRL